MNTKAAPAAFPEELRVRAAALKGVFFPAFYLQVDISIIGAGELGIFDFATGNPSGQICT